MKTDEMIRAEEKAYHRALVDVIAEAKKVFHVDAASVRQVILVVERVQAKVKH